MPAERKSIAERIVEHSQFEPMTGCLLWTGFVDKGGYPMTLGPTRNLVYVSRVLWEALNDRSLLTGECVLHRCDTPACINPKHLFIGSQRDNMLDCIRKGRSKLNRYAKRQLTDEQVQDCLLYTSPSPRDGATSRMPSSA